MPKREPTREPMTPLDKRCILALQPVRGMSTNAQRIAGALQHQLKTGQDITVRMRHALYAICWRFREQLDIPLQVKVTGKNRHGLRVPMLFHTSHPGLAAALRRDPCWEQLSAMLYGGNKLASRRSIVASAERAGVKAFAKTGYGGHFRAVQGFRYYGPP